MADKESFFLGPRPETDKFPNASRVGDLIFTSGMVAINDQFDVLSPNDVDAQADVVFDRLAKLLEHTGSDMQHVVKINAYLTRADDYVLYNEARHRWFPVDPPASATVIVASLVRPGIVVEIEAVALACNGNRSEGVALG